MDRPLESIIPINDSSPIRLQCIPLAVVVAVNSYMHNHACTISTMVEIIHNGFLCCNKHAFVANSYYNVMYDCSCACYECLLQMHTYTLQPYYNAWYYYSYYNVLANEKH